MINSGEYLDASGKRALMSAGATDIVNVHGQVTDVMRIGWLAADLGIPVSLGNTFLEMGFAHVLRIPIYTLNSLPQSKYQPELIAMEPTILNGDLDILTKH